MRIDLHTHSSASDGTDSPAQLMRAAAAAGLDVVAITDHDTTAGWAEAFANRPAGLTVVPGIEMSCVYRGERRISLHLLGYFADPANDELQAEWARLRDGRLIRGRQMADNLEAAGYPISWAQVSALANGAPIGRPHLGRALVEAGVVPDVDAAFRELLSSRQPYYVRKADSDVFDAIRLICGAGGLPVFAHPLARRRGPVVSDEVVAQMAAAGLVGLEVDHPDQDPDDRADAARLARDLDLIPTGSSDYHGTNKRTPIAACTTDPDAFARLLELPAALVPVAD
ncbi:PHP domain-containing protein [uncultured Jatrophihabitans sp.]|uniref:PHP domain-containing protein n=1 Tax=uncultured Jatrophihabitans sp. TaxID=1610747 RepID=UPI0035CC6FF5